MNTFETEVHCKSGEVRDLAVHFPSGPVRITQHMVRQEAMRLAKDNGWNPEFARLVFNSPTSQE